MLKTFLIEKISGLAGFAAFAAMLAYSGMTASPASVESRIDVCLGKARRPALVSESVWRANGSAPVQAGFAGRSIVSSICD